MKLLSYPRALFILIFGVLHTLIMSAVVVVLAYLTRSMRLSDFLVSSIWSKGLLLPLGVEVQVRGRERISTTVKGFLVVFNHSSLLDIPVLFAHLPRPIRFGAKIELFKIPLFGKAMEILGILPIDRAHRSKVMKVYESAIARIENGECFALAPEGTRQDSLELGKFKRGPFEFALNAKADIVPVVIAGVLDVLPKKSIWVNTGRWRRRILIEITPPIASTSYSMENIVELQDRVRDQMAAVFAGLNEELIDQRI